MARMAHELCAAFFDRPKSCRERLLVQGSGQAKPDEVIGHAHTAPFTHTPVQWIGDPAREVREGRRSVQRQPDKRDLELLRQPDHGLEYRGNDMGVFMGIKMGRGKTGRNDAFDLSPQFGVDVQMPADERGDDAARRLGKRSSSEQRSTLHEHEVTPDVEGRCFTRETNGILECIAVRHDSRGCENSLSMRVNDARINVTREAEIIGVDD